MNGYNVLEYFKEKADRYDDVEEQIYWRLSDKLLWNIFQETAINNLDQSFMFLDAGGGTGRWSIKILQEYELASGYICDLSKDMLEQANAKVKNFGLGERLKLINGNIQNMNNFESEMFDLTFNFHNVLGFVESPETALLEMARVTKRDGFVVSFVPNLFHCIFFNITQANIDDAETALDNNKGRFIKDMPFINLFTPETITGLYEKAGLKVEFITGFPSVIYPGYQETQLSGSTKDLADILEDEATFSRIFSLEKRLSTYLGIVSRGNNIYIVGRKVAS